MPRLIRTSSISPICLILILSFILISSKTDLFTRPESLLTKGQVLQTSLPSCEVRGTWLNPDAFNNPERRGATLSKILAANLNTVFLAAHPLNGNDGWSGREDFETFLYQLKENGISVHVWICNKFRDGGNQVDFTDPVEQEAQKNWVMDWLNEYPDLDGVHFDYIRYEDWEDVNQNGKMDGVTATISQAYSALKASYPDKFLTATSFSLEANYVDFSQEDVPQWFRSWFNAHPDNWFETAYPNFDTVPEHMKFQQNPVGWIDSSIIDGVLPMQYTTQDSQWNREVDLYGSFLDFLGQPRHKVFPGLGWLTEAGHPDWDYDAPGIARKIEYGRSQGLNGFVIFQLGDSGVDDQPLIEALADGPFKTSAPSCLASFPSPTLTISPSSPPPTPTPTPPSHCLPLGDVDCSGKVNGLDFGSLVAHWGTADPEANLDDLGKVDALDALILLGNYGQTI